jgi:L-alanine-DL-glutamate epimerase-like enolase superfamily enzyme
VPEHLFVDDSVSEQNFEEYKRITAATVVPNLPGENLSAIQDWRALLKNQACNNYCTAVGTMAWAVPV